MLPIVHSFEQAILAFDRPAAQVLMAKGVAQSGAFPFVEAVVVPALEHIGQQWEKGDLALSQVYMSGKICEELVDAILPPASPQRTSQPSMAIALLCDYHSLGKMIIRSALRASGFELIDFGRVEVDALVDKVDEYGIRILLISVLMLPSALQVKQVCECLRRRHGKSVRIVVGGAPFRLEPMLCQEVGADATGKDSSEAIAVVNAIIKEMAS